MGHQWDQGRNQKIPCNKWEGEHNNPNSEGHRESNPKCEIYSITGLIKKNTPRESSNEQSNFTLKGTWKRTPKKSQSEQKKEIIKIRGKINKIDSKKMI